jgi:hypothetical protein
MLLGSEAADKYVLELLKDWEVIMRLTLFLVLALILARGFHAPGYSQANKLNPAARYGHRIAYDEARQMALMFGGRGEEKVSLGDTWGWDGGRWKLLGSTGPTARAFHAMAYDTARRVVVLFGGRDSSQKSLGDTWEWDGNQWRLVSAVGPPARDHHAMTYDAVRGKIVLFGGFDGRASNFGDTWEWDGKTWTAMSSPGPSARASHQLVFDPQRAKTVLFGGRCRAGESYTCADTWVWDGKRWEKIADGESEGRSHFGMTFNPNCRCIIRFGGGNSARVPLGDTWRFAEGKWTRIATAGPQARVDLVMTYHRHRKRVVLFGGYIPSDGGPVFADTWVWNGKSWEQL